MDQNELRELASGLREVAGRLTEKTAGEELDPEKVRDFLIFYGGRHE